jgi:mannosyltransferase OCH1-like enzyme
VWFDADLAASKAGWVTRTRWYERAIVERPLAAKDMARLAILDAYGGVYSDWDVEWLRPISDTGEWPRTDGRALVGYEDDRWLCNAVIAAPAGHDAITASARCVRGGGVRQPDGSRGAPRPARAHRRHARVP